LSREFKKNLTEAEAGWQGEFGERLLAIRRKLGLTQKELSSECKRASNQSISTLERGKTTQIPLDFLGSLCRFFRRKGVSLRWLFLNEGPPFEAEAIRNIIRHGAMEDLIEGLRAQTLTRVAAQEGLSIVGKQGRRLVTPADVLDAGEGVISAIPNVLWTVPVEVGRRELEGHRPSGQTVPGYRTVSGEDVSGFDWADHYVPVLGRISAGDGASMHEPKDYPPAWAGEFLCFEGAGPSCVAVRVSGASMEPRYHHGDMVIIDPSLVASVGSICCIVTENDGEWQARLKRFLVKGKTAVLESLHPDRRFRPERIPLASVLHAYPILHHIPLVRVLGPDREEEEQHDKAKNCEHRHR